MNRFAQAYAVAVNDAGTRINDKPVSCVDRLAFHLFEWGGAKDLKITFRFVYPFVGGTAGAHSINLADPTVGRIIWDGTVTHNVNGVTGDGVSGYGSTGMTLAGPAIKDAFVSFGVYSRSATTGQYAEIGNYGLGSPGLLIYARYTDGLARFYNGPTGLLPSVPNSQGFFVALRNSAVALYAYRNGTLISSAASNNAVVDPPIPILILARPGSDPDPDLPPILFSNRNLAFAFLTNAPDTPGIGGILSSPKVTELYNYVQSFQQKLLRSV